MTDSPHRIARVSARRVWDSRGRPTVEAEVYLPGGVSGRATVWFWSRTAIASASAAPIQIGR